MWRRLSRVLVPVRRLCISPAIPSNSPLTGSVLRVADNCSQCGKVPGFHMRALPNILVQFPSAEGKRLFRQSLDAGFCESYFALSATFHSQTEPAFCGLASLVMVLNALGCDPGKIWKGPWRWYSEEMLIACFPLGNIHTEGIDLDQFCDLARQNGSECTKVRPQECTLEDFRTAVKQVTASSDAYLVANFDRASLMQTGTGHFSPIAAYEAESDMVLVLDVASFKYRPYFVSLPVLYQAMFPLDSVTGKSRGFVVMKKSESDVHSSIHANTNMQPLSAITVEFARTVQSAASQIRADLSSSDEDMKFTVKTLLEAVPQDLNDRLRSFTYRIIMGACGDHRTAINSLLAEIRRTRMYALTTEALKKSPRYVLAPELASVLLLSFPESVFSNLPVPALERLRSLRSMEDMGAVLMSEIIQLRTDLHSMCSSGDSCALKHGSVQCTC